MNIPSHVNTLLFALRERGFAAHPVGGCVRDSLMGRAPADWDVCTAARPEQVEEIFQNYRLIETGLRHGTVTVLSEGHPVEITTFRTDGTYHDSRHPDAVTFVRDLEADLARRDFTVNAMAFGAKGEVIDLYGGRTDLERGLIRCVGDPDERFGEDALRILRALRFASRLDFEIETATAQSAVKNRALLRNIARERVFSELKGILIGPGAGRVLRQYAPVIFEILPELEPQAGFDQKNPNHIHDIWTHTTMAVQAIAPDPVLRLAMLLHDVGKPATFFTDEAGVGHFYGHDRVGAEMADGILRCLKCDNATREAVCLLVRYHNTEPPRTEKAMRRLLAKVGEPVVRQLIQCGRADCADRAEEVQVRNFAAIDLAEGLLEKVLAGPERCFDMKSLAVSGRDIMALGVKEGPAVGAVLKTLFDLVVDGALPNDREALMAKAEALLSGDCAFQNEGL